MRLGPVPTSREAKTRTGRPKGPHPASTPPPPLRVLRDRRHLAVVHARLGIHTAPAPTGIESLFERSGILIETVALREEGVAGVLSPDQHGYNEPDAQEQEAYGGPGRAHLFRQALRFGLAGGLNTVVDLLILNGLLWLFPTTSTLTLLAYNSLAYSLGAINSFFLNKYWTFGSRQRVTRGELARFTLITLCGIGWSGAILWCAGTLLHPFLVNATVWANASKVVAIAGTALISYLGMRLWVFVSKTQKEQTQFSGYVPADSNARGEDRAMLRRDRLAYIDAANDSNARGEDRAMLSRERIDSIDEHEHSLANEDGRKTESLHSLSVVLPVYNEDAVIGATLEQVLNVLEAWLKDFEVIVVDDGSTDSTGEIVSAVVEVEPRVRAITHERNQGYGAALADGFAAATKELTFFMDSDGQFDFRDLARLLLFIDEYDAVIGYRLHRQDTWLRKLNAWGWNALIRNILGIHVRDIDCAFKLFHAAFLQQHPPKTRGAMINAELLYQLKHVGYIYREVGVHHLPRRGGRATGANLRVIVRAFRELFSSARQWRSEERAHAQRVFVSEHHPF
jgi:putative flippase GtrA